MRAVRPATIWHPGATGPVARHYDLHHYCRYGARLADAALHRCDDRDSICGDHHFAHTNWMNPIENAIGRTPSSCLPVYLSAATPIPFFSMLYSSSSSAAICFEGMLITFNHAQSLCCFAPSPKSDSVKVVTLCNACSPRHVEKSF